MKEKLVFYARQQVTRKLTNVTAESKWKFYQIILNKFEYVCKGKCLQLPTSLATYWSDSHFHKRGRLTKILLGFLYPAECWISALLYYRIYALFYYFLHIRNQGSNQIMSGNSTISLAFPQYLT